MYFDRDAFLAWAEAQSRGRFERVRGEVIAMSPERWEHARLKAAIWRALDDGARTIPGCSVAPDGMTVAIDADTDFEPDVSIHCGEPIPRDSMTVPNPVVIVEVVSPSTQRIDTTVKREAYFRVDSIAHYLVFRADRREVLHWRRDTEIPARLTQGLLQIAPPGITLDLDAVYSRAETS
jgi:Uma2 family endonuclease